MYIYISETCFTNCQIFILKQLLLTYNTLDSAKWNDVN